MSSTLLFLMRSAFAGTPMLPTGDAPTAAAQDRGTLLLGVGAAGGYAHDRAIAGGALSARWAPVRRLQLAAEVEQGATWLTCPDCGGATTTISTRYNLLNGDAFRLGAYGLSSATLASSLTGQVAAGVSAEGGIGPVRLDVSAPIWSTTDLLERMLHLPEAGLTVQISEQHAARLSARGVEFRPGLAYQYTQEQLWFEVVAHLPEDGSPTMRAQIGLRR